MTLINLGRRKHHGATILDINLRSRKAGLLPLDGMVAELNHPLPVLDHVTVVAGALRGDVVEKFRLHVELPVNLFQPRGEEALQTQQISTEHARPRNRREPAAFRPESQLRDAA
jgi:hypothetical protein